MNHHFTIQIYTGSQKAEVTHYRVCFASDMPGRAQITVKGTPDVHTIVAIDLGWGDCVCRVFTGYIERVTPEKPGYSAIFCREMAAILYRPFNVVIRQPTLMQLLSNLTEQTGLQFVVPEKAYSKQVIPCFYSIGNGYRVLDEIGQAFNITDYMWQQQGNGQVYVGSWQDSYWADKPVTIPNELMTNHRANKTVTLPCIPQLKPGAIVNGLQLTEVEHTATESTLTWM